MATPKFIIIMDGVLAHAALNIDGSPIPYAVIDCDTDGMDDEGYEIPQLDDEGSFDGYKRARCYTSLTTPALHWGPMVVEALEAGSADVES